MADFAEVLLAQPEEDAAVHLAVAADEIMQARPERRAGGAVPGLVGLIPRVDEHRFGVPVLALAGKIVAALEQQDALAGLSELPRHCGAARAGADDDDIVALVHAMMPAGCGRPRD